MDIIQIKVDLPPSYPIFDKFDLPPSPRIFDKNHEIHSFETYILYYPYYFLRVRGTDRTVHKIKVDIFHKWLGIGGTRVINPKK